MDRIIDVKVRGSYLARDRRMAGVQGEANSTSLRIEFDESWDGYAKKVTWWDALGQNPVERTLTADLLEDLTQSTRIYLCPIPGEPLAESGMCTFVIDGWVEGKRQRSLSAELEVPEAWFIEHAEEPADPTPTQAEQLQGQIDTLLGDMQGVAQEAEGAAARAEIAEANAADNVGLAWDYARLASQHAAQAETTAEEMAQAAQKEVDRAQAAADRAEGYTSHPPRVNDSTGFWQEWDGTAYSDTNHYSRGESGESFKVLGYYATADELRAAHPEPEDGEAYGVGTEQAYSIYMWDGEAGIWRNHGSLNAGTVQLPGHATSHAAGGDDPIDLDGIGAAPSGFGLGTLAKNISNTDLLDTMKKGQSGFYRGDGVTNAPVTGNCYFIVISSSTTYGVVFALTSNGPVYLCLYQNGAFGTWRKIYDEFSIPTLMEIGAASASHFHFAEDVTEGVFPIERGGTGAATAAEALANLGGVAKDGSTPMSGALNITMKTYPTVRLDQTTVGSRVSLQSIGHSLALGMYNVAGETTKGRSLYIRDSSAAASALNRALELYDNDNSKFYRVYGEHNKPTPADLGTAHVAYGTYQGTGKYGEEDPTVLTFDFAPKLLWIFGKYEVNSDNYLSMEDVTSGLYRFTLDIEACLSADRIYVGLTNQHRLYLSVSDDGKTVSMYSTSGNGAAAGQANESGYVYQYLAIG